MTETDIDLSTLEDMEFSPKCEGMFLDNKGETLTCTEDAAWVIKYYAGQCCHIYWNGLYCIDCGQKILLRVWDYVCPVCKNTFEVKKLTDFVKSINPI